MTISRKNSSEKRTGILLRSLFAIAACLGSLVGCSRGPESISEMDLAPVREEMAEVSLGYYSIPVPMDEIPEHVDWSHGNTLCVSFDLYAIVKPKDRSRVEELFGRYEKSFRNEVMKAVRSASMHDLREPTLSTLKTQVTIIAGRWLGQYRIRRLVFAESEVRPL